MMELILGGLLLAALVLLFFAGKRSGKIEQKNDQLSKLLHSQVSVQSNIDAQLARFDSKMERMEKKIYEKNIHLLTNNDLNQLWSQPTDVNLQVDPTPLDKSETE